MSYAFWLEIHLNIPMIIQMNFARDQIYVFVFVTSVLSGMCLSEIRVLKIRWIFYVSQLARRGSLDFNEGATPPSLFLPPSPSSPLGFLLYTSIDCGHERIAAISRTPDAVGHTWTRT